MAEKRYYWLKLNEDYLTSPKIKKLRKIAGGDTFTIIYLKMQLMSVKNKGIITFEGIEETFEEELSLKLDEDLDNVKITLSYLQAQGLIENDNNEFLLTEACKNIGSEVDSAERVRAFRERQKMLQCNDSVTSVKQISISNSISKSNSISNKREIEDIIESIEYEPLKITLQEFIKMRKAIKKPLTPYGFELLLKNLNKLTVDVDEQVKILEQSISNCWQGVFALKDDKKEKKSAKDEAFDKGMSILNKMLKGETK